MKTIFLLFAAVLSASTAGQEPSLQDREALYHQYLRAPALVRGGAVQARWLEDGSSFWYRAEQQAMFVDPAEGKPRKATREDRDRELETERAPSGGRVNAPKLDRHVRLMDKNLVVRGEGLESDLSLTDDGGDDVLWSLEPDGWSSDGSMLFSTRIDLHLVHHLPVVDFGKAVETVERRPYVKTGTTFGRFKLAVFHLSSGTRVDVDLGSDADLYIFPIGWRAGDAEILFLRLNRVASRLDLMAADPASGASRIILTDTRETFVGGLDFITGGWREYFTPIEGTERFLWISERDGWRHVYQYDYQGGLIGRVTKGEFPVLQVLGVDPGRQRVFVTANAEERPYDTHFYSADLRGGELRRLTEGDGEHQIQLAPSKLYFVDTHSSLDRPPVSELRAVDGRLICKLAEADVSPLEAMGWRPPEPFVVKAADGETDLYGALFKPSYFDPSARYPVIDIIYTGPFITIVPNEYGSRSPYPRRAQAMAQMGFVVILLDPRGTTERGKAFQDASYGRIGEIEIPDHVAALHQLAAQRPYIDLDRVGVYGHSWGGYFALRAMLTAPEVFRVGIASAPGELTEAAPINEPYMRLPASNPAGYAAALNAPLAANLKGKLLLIHGTADVNAPFSTTMRMVDALIDVDKPFDLLVLPGATHSYQGSQERYASKRVRSYFLEHLRAEPRQN